jgi:hypothetical protein
MCDRTSGEYMERGDVSLGDEVVRRKIHDASRA